MIKPINTLRFLFMMMIFFHHIDLYPGGGSLAVSAFFIISGFCLSLGYGEKVMHDDFNYTAYLKKRLCKFYPIHWIFLAVFVTMGLLLDSSFHISLRPLLANVLLLQSWVPEQDFYFSYNVVSWYLSGAVFMTLLFPLLFPIIHKLSKKQKWIFLALLILVYASMVVFVPGGGLRKALLYINPLVRCFDLIVGVLLFHLYDYMKDNPMRMGGYRYEA